MTALAFSVHSQCCPDRAQIRGLMEDDKVLADEVAKCPSSSFAPVSSQHAVFELGDGHERNDAAVPEDIRQIELFTAVSPKEERDCVGVHNNIRLSHSGDPGLCPVDEQL